MYGDPKRVRQRYGSINLDAYEKRLVDALVDYTGIERGALLRQLVLKEAMETLGVDVHAGMIQSRTG